MLTQKEADSLIAIKKDFISTKTITIPPGADQTHELICENKREMFLLDLWRGTMRLTKHKFQTRGRSIIVLVRLDIDGSPHTNPNGTMLEGTHLHLYKEGYEDKWAYPVDKDKFKNLDNIGQTFMNFCSHCNIRNISAFQGNLL